MIDVAGALLLVAEVTFAFQQSEHPSDCGIGRWIREVGEYVGGGGAAAAVYDFHDLTLAAPELV
jgi:hypothetical protein